MIFMYVFVSFVLALFLGEVIIPALRRLHASQTEREELSSHKKKEGTPTMGGVVFIFAIVLSFMYCIKDTKDSLPVLLLACGFGLIGFVDDYLKVVLRRADGFKAREKFFFQILVCIAFLVFYGIFIKEPTNVLIPLTDGLTFNFGFFIFPILFIAILGTVNGVNFTDGLDGLAASVTSVINVFFAYVSFNNAKELFPLTLLVLGALLGFLCFNVYPAKTFMGDTGSLFLGGYVAGMAVMLKIPLHIVIFGFIYFAEVLSVIMQVSYFKATHGKRIFRMAPIHHHFELGGWSETRVVYVFSLVSLFLCLLSVRGL